MRSPVLQEGSAESVGVVRTSGGNQWVTASHVSNQLKSSAEYADGSTSTSQFPAIPATPARVLEVERIGVVAVGVVAGAAQVDEHVAGRSRALGDPIWPAGGMSAKIVRLLRRVAGVRHTLTTESRLLE